MVDGDEDGDSNRVIRTTRTMRVKKMTRKMTMVKAKAMRTNISVT